MAFAEGKRTPAHPHHPHPPTPMKLGMDVKGARALDDGTIEYESLPAGTELRTRVVRGLTEYVAITGCKGEHEYAIVDVFPDRLDHALTYLTTAR